MYEFPTRFDPIAEFLAKFIGDQLAGILVFVAILASIILVIVVFLKVIFKICFAISDDFGEYVAKILFKALLVGVLFVGPAMYLMLYIPGIASPFITFIHIIVISVFLAHFD